MFAFCRLSLLLTVALLSLVSCQDSDLDCECTNFNNKSRTVELDCRKTLDGILEIECDRAEVASIPDGYSLIDGYGLYKLYRQAVEWEYARNSCWLEGGQLAVPQDETQYAGLVELLGTATGITIAWTGVNDLEEDSTYVDTEGNSVSYLPWRTDQPDHHLDSLGREEHCVEIRSDGINDIHCTDQAAFICEISLSPDGYTWVAGANRFVKVHTDEVTYEEAQASCEAEDAALVVLENWDRAAAVLEVLPEDIGDSWVGFTDAEDEGNFITSTRRKLSDMEFVNWDKDEPDNGSDGDAENCLTLAYKGWYNDQACTNNYTFICQIPPP